MADIHANGRMSAKITVGTVQVYSDGIDPELVYTKEEMNELLGNKADTVHAHEEYLTEVPSNYATTRISKLVGFNEETETPIYEHYDMTQEDFAIRFGSTEECALAASELAVQNADNIELIDTSLENKADINHTHEEYLTEHQDISHLASTSYVDDAIDNIDIPEVDLSNCATKEELNEVKQSVSDGKTLIASAITDKGVNTSNTDSFQVMANNISNIPLEGGDPYYEELYNARTKNGTNMTALFAYSEGDNLDLRKLNVSNVTNMNYMFEHATVKSIDITGWDTSNVTNMSNMFYWANTIVDLNNLELDNLTSMENMFNYAYLDNIKGIENMKFPKVTSISYVFDSAKKNGVFDLSNWDVSNITRMYGTFSSIDGVTELNLSNWDTSKVTEMGSFFPASYSAKLERLIIPDWDMTNVTSYGYMFGYSADYTKNLNYIDLSRSNDITIKKIAERLYAKSKNNYGDMLIPTNTSQDAIDAIVAKYWRPVGPIIEFESLEVVPELDEIVGIGKKSKLHAGGSPWYGSKEDVEFISSDESIAYINEDNELVSVSYGSVDIYARMKSNNSVVSNTITINVSETDSYPNVIKFRAGTTSPGTYHYITVNSNNVKLTDMDYNSASNIYTYDVGEPITSIRFNGQGSLSYGNIISELIKLNISNMTDMSYMFGGCTSLTSLDLSSFDTSNVTNMSYMFYYCSSLTSLNLSSFDTSNVTNMSNMFSFASITVDWCYDGTNYQNWTLTEGQTGFSGTFPWNEEKEGE